MTNYNERLYEIFETLNNKAREKRASCTERNNWEGYNSAYERLENEAKQAIIKLIEDEAREAVWKEKERIYEFATRKQANGLYVPIELGIEPWLREQLRTITNLSR